MEEAVSALMECGAIQIITDELDCRVEVLATETEHFPVVLDTSMFGRFEYTLLLPWGMAERLQFNVRNISRDSAAAVADMILAKEDT